MEAEYNYGSLDFRNVSHVKLGRFEFNTWFGNSALFVSLDNGESHVLACKNSDLNGVRPGRTPHKLTDTSPWLDRLHVCPYCFKYTDIEQEMNVHVSHCPFIENLPGKVMYVDKETNFVVRKVRGMKYPLFCQNMCLLAKFFLDNKSVFYYLNQYDFYVAYETLDGVETPMGFYSRELTSWEKNNLSCICVFPCYQLKRIGTKLIDFSYRLSKYEKQISGPERPLSNFGKLSYLKYWCKNLSWELTYGKLNYQTEISLEIISKETNFRVNDTLMALDFMEVLYQKEDKPPYVDFYMSEFRNRDHYVLLKDPQGNFKLAIDRKRVKKWLLENNITEGGHSELKESMFVLY